MPTRKVMWILWAVLALPFIGSAVQVVTGDDYPRDHDTALVELRTSDVFSDDPPLVGSYERFGGNQPGPWLFYLLAPGQELLGAAGAALTTLVVGWLCAAGTVAVARRLGGTPLMLLAGGFTLVLLAGRGLDQLANPWEPMISLLALWLVSFLLWAYCDGRFEVLPALAALVVVLATIWVFLAPVLLVCSLLAIGATVAHWWWARRDSDPATGRRLGRNVALASIVVVLLALPLLAEQVSGDPGNLTQLMDVADRSAAGRAGFSTGWTVATQQLDPWPVWAGDELALGIDGTADLDFDGLPLLAVIWLAAAAWTAWVLLRGGATESAVDRVGAVRLGWLHAVVGALVLGVVFATGLVSDGVFSWIMEPSRVIGACAALAVCWTLLRFTPAAVRARWRSAAVNSALVIVALAGAATAVGAALDSGEADQLGPAIDQLSIAATERVAGGGPVQLSSEATAGTIFGAEEFGVAEMAAELERSGVDVRVDPSLESRFGPARSDLDGVEAELRLRSDGSAPDGTGWTLVASVDPFEGDLRDRRERLDEQIRSLSDGAEGARLLTMAEGDEELRALLEESFDLGDQPVLHLWYRPAVSG